MIKSGVCGKDLTWTLDEDGSLTKSGEGEMDDYFIYEAAWFYEIVEKIIIRQGVTSIGDSAFIYPQRHRLPNPGGRKDGPFLRLLE